jgi:hypothetical protein
MRAVCVGRQRPEGKKNLGFEKNAFCPIPKNRIWCSQSVSAVGLRFAVQAFVKNKVLYFS